MNLTDPDSPGQIFCAKCEQQVSEHNEVCPHCHNPLRSPDRRASRPHTTEQAVMSIVGYALVLVGLGGCPASVQGIDRYAETGFMTPFAVALVGGFALRGIAGIWQSVERIAAEKADH